MKRVEVGSWKLLCDPEATREAYERARDIGPETCSCSYCRNWIAARQRIYAEPVGPFFAGLGIDPPREVETYELGPAEGGRLYGGWAHFIGEIIASAPQESGTLVITPPPDRRHFEVCFHNQPAMLASSFRGKPVVQLEFTLVVPWLLEEPVPE